MPAPTSRQFRLFLGGANALLSGYVVASGLWEGSVPGFRRASLLLNAAEYRADTQSFEFWLILSVFTVLAAASVWLAWSAWRK